jgi:uncharacterized protein involved in type VI secretion and phage assembly
MMHDHPPDGAGPRFFGVYPAIVTNLVDPRQMGRIEVKFPWLGTQGHEDVRAWATLVSPYADADQGFEILPEVGTQVVVAFEAGHPDRAYILGASWNGKEALPEPPSDPNNKRLIKTRSGSLLEFDDTAGAPKITVSTKNGHTLVLDDGGQEVRLRHANGCVITMNAGGQVTVTANSTVEVMAPALNVHAASAVFDGTVSCTTLTASIGVVSPSYTPGAGNVW